MRDAILWSCGANATHGVRRTNEDKRRAVMKLLNDPEWSESMPDREIARICGVDNAFVGKLRPKPAPSVDGQQIERTRTVERNGTKYQQNTSNIGRNPAAAPAEAPREKFNFEAAAIRDKVFNAIRALASAPDHDEVVDAMMESQAYGEPVESIEKAIAWLEAFLPLYRKAEPKRGVREDIVK